MKYEPEKDFLEYFNIPFPYSRPRSDWIDTDPTKILSLSDPHEPYGNEIVYREALKHKDSWLCYVNGDLGDYYSKSRFRKTKYVSFKDEVRAVFYRLEWLATHWKTVRVLIGNHDNRPEKTISNLFANNTDLLILTEQNLIVRLASYFDNVEIVGQQLDGSGKELTHIYQLGDIVFTHGEISRTQKTATLEYISRYLFRWAKLYDLKPYSVLVQGHNHQDLKTKMGSEAWFMVPTCSDPYSLGMEYIYSSRMAGNPPQVGYSLFYQENGITDYNRSTNVVVL